MSTPSKPGAMSAMARELARTDTLKIDRVLAPVWECLKGLRTNVVGVRNLALQALSHIQVLVSQRSN